MEPPTNNNRTPQPPAAASALSAYAMSLPALPIHTRSVSVAQTRQQQPWGAQSGRSSVPQRSSALYSDRPPRKTPVAHTALNDAPFLVRDKVKAMEQYAVMAAPRRPGGARGAGDDNRARAVPLPVMVVGMESSVVSLQQPSYPSRLGSPSSPALMGIDPEVHEAIIADTIAKLTSVFQHRLQQHAIAATVRHFTQDLVAETARNSRPHTMLDIKGPSPQTARLPPLGLDAVAALDRAINDPPASSLLCRAASPGSVWRTPREANPQERVASPRRAPPSMVPVQPNASSTTPFTQKQPTANSSMPERWVGPDAKHSLLRHPAITAPWSIAGRKPQTKVLGDSNHHLRHTTGGPLLPIQTTLTSTLLAAHQHQQQAIASEADDGAYVPLAEEALSQILGGRRGDGGPAQAEVKVHHVVSFGDHQQVTATNPPMPPPRHVETATSLPLPQPTSRTMSTSQHPPPPGVGPVGKDEQPTRSAAPPAPHDEGRSGHTLVASHDLAMAIAQLLSDNDEPYSSVPRRHPPPSSGATPGSGTKRPAAIIASTVGAAATSLHPPRSSQGQRRTPTPRSSEVMDHITFDPSQHKWVALSRPGTRECAAPATEHRPTTAEGADLPSLLVLSDELVPQAMPAQSQPPVASAQGTRPVSLGATGGAVGEARTKSRGGADRWEGVIPKSPFGKSPRITSTDVEAIPSLQSPRHTAVSVGGKKPPLHVTTSSPHDSPQLGGGSPNTRGSPGDVLSPTVAKKSVFASTEKRKANAQPPVEHDSSIVLRLDQSFGHAEEEALREAASTAAAAAKASRNARIKVLKHATRAALTMLHDSIQQTSSGAIPQSVKDLLPVPMNAEIAAGSSSVSDPRVLSADQATLEAQVEREVIQTEYDKILAPAKEVKSKVDSSAALLKQAVQLKLKYRETLVKKYDALQHVKSSHGEVMQTMSALHDCLASGKESVDDIPLATLMAAIGSLTSMERDGASEAAIAATRSVSSIQKTNSISAVGRTKSKLASHTLGTRKSLPGGNNEARGGVPTDHSVHSSGSSSDDDDQVVAKQPSPPSAPSQNASKAPKVAKATPAAAVSTSKSRAAVGGKPVKGKPVATGKKQQQQPGAVGTSFPSQEEQEEPPTAAVIGSTANNTTTAELLRQAQRAKASSVSATSAVVAVTAVTGTGNRARVRLPEDGQQQGVADSAPAIPPPQAVLVMRKSLTRASATFRESKARFDHAQTLMINRGKALVKSRKGAISPSAGTDAGGSPSKRIPAGLESKLANGTSDGLSAAAEKEYISAAVSDELQAEFHDINARRDSQRQLAERQEKELEELRQDMKRLTSGSEATRDEAAAQLTSMVQHRERSIADETVRAAGALGLAPIVATSGGAGEATDEDGLADLQRPGFVETQHAAVQVEEDIQPASGQQAACPEQAGQLGDLYRLERLLLQSVRRLMVAVAHVMLFHDSIAIELTCKRCLDVFSAPQMLWPCGHVFCHDCLQSMYDPASEMLTCAECGTLADIGFTPDPILQNLGFYQNQFRQHASFAGKQQQQRKQQQQQQRRAGGETDTPIVPKLSDASGPLVSRSIDEDTFSRMSSTSVSSSPTLKPTDRGSNRGTVHQPSRQAASLPEVLRELLRDLGGTDDGGVNSSVGSASPSSTVGGSFGSPPMVSMEL